MSAAAILSRAEARATRFERKCAAMRAGEYARRERKPLGAYDMPPTVSNGMAWDRSAVCALALRECHTCHGSGLRAVWHGATPQSVPCNCVFRSIFRAVMRAYRYRREFRPVGGISFRFAVPGRKSEEFLADVWLVAKRHLDEAHWPVFLLHFVEGRDWRACTTQLRMDRGNFFHSVYRIEQQLGRVFRELRPYALFPVDEYFDGTGDHPADYFYRRSAEDAFDALWAA